MRSVIIFLNDKRKLRSEYINRVSCFSKDSFNECWKKSYPEAVQNLLSTVELIL